MRAKAITLLTFLFFTISVAQAATQKVLYTFTGGADGAQPYAGVIFDKAGNLYGVTQAGGLYDEGTVFQLSPQRDGSWTETVLYNFTGHTDGAMPVGGLHFDSQGNLHGSAANGGDRQALCGTLFKLTPSEQGWIFALTHTFLGSPDDGCAPCTEFVPYLTTVAGGRWNDGATWDDYDNLYSFGSNAGSEPWGAINEWGYGTAYSGGAHGDGTVYYLTSKYCGDGPARYNCHAVAMPIHQFAGGKKGSHPMGDLLTASVGGTPVMYGTTSGGAGTIYQLTQNANGHWKYHVIYGFSGTDGSSPSAGVIADAAGNLYGTTTWGGPAYSGTVFKLAPGIGKHDKVVWSLTTLYNFTGGDDGSDLYSRPVFDSAGNLYGTAVKGGAYGQGVVYEIIP